MPYYRKPRRPEVERALKLPQEGELLGTVIKIEGASRFMVSCADGNDRLCSIPGRFKRRFWIKINDTVIVKPWIVQSNERGDIVWKYRILEVSKLRERKLL